MKHYSINKDILGKLLQAKNEHILICPQHHIPVMLIVYEAFILYLTITIVSIQLNKLWTLSINGNGQLNHLSTNNQTWLATSHFMNKWLTSSTSFSQIGCIVEGVSIPLASKFIFVGILSLKGYRNTFVQTTYKTPISQHNFINILSRTNNI